MIHFRHLTLALTGVLALAPAAVLAQAAAEDSTSTAPEADTASTGTASGKRFAVVGGYSLSEPTRNPAIAGTRSSLDGDGAATLSASYYINDNIAVEAWGAADKFSHRVNTASGKAEVYATTFEGWGMDALPFYTEPPQSEYSTPELFKKYPLVMITGARSQIYFHAEHRQIPWLREKLPDPTVEIHPETAKRYGIYDGEWVHLVNDMGRVKRKAKFSLQVKRHHVHTMHGWWLPELEGKAPSLYGVGEYQINNIIPGPQCSKSGFGGGQYKTTLCTLAKIAA